MYTEDEFNCPNVMAIYFYCHVNGSFAHREWYSGQPDQYLEPEQHSNQPEWFSGSLEQSSGQPVCDGNENSIYTYLGYTICNIFLST